MDASIKRLRQEIENINQYLPEGNEISLSKFGAYNYIMFNKNGQSKVIPLEGLSSNAMNKRECLIFLKGMLLFQKLSSKKKG